MFYCPTIHNSSLRPSHTCFTSSKITLLYIYSYFFPQLSFDLLGKKVRLTQTSAWFHYTLKCRRSQCYNVLVKQRSWKNLSLSLTHSHTHTHSHKFPQGDIEEISCDPSSSPFSFHFLYLPDGKQLTTITSPPLHAFTHRLVFISLPLTSNTQTLNLILIASNSSHRVVPFNIIAAHRTLFSWVSDRYIS